MALYNYLYARKTGGKWILRIEDTDSTRFVPGSVDGIRNALDWAGLDYDYGPGKEGPHAPYYQSERLDLYRDYAKKLLENGSAYRCFCSMDKLTATRERLARTGSNSTYDKTCLHLSDEEVSRKVQAGEKFIVRINDSFLPSRPPADDLVFGQLKDAHASLPTDPVLLKTDQWPTYHLASVVDDHEMGITHVLRGEEWLPSLPLHLDLYAHLNLQPPKFAHVPVLLNADGTKMSKRNGDVQVVDYIRRGWEPEAMLNWLALAGWGARHEPPSSSPSPSSSTLETQSPTHAGAHAPRPLQIQSAPDSTRIMTRQELISEFDLSAITQRSSSLDATKLEYINKHHLMLKWRSSEEGGGGGGGGGEGGYTSVERIQHAVRLLDGRLTNLQDIPTHAPWLFVEPDFSSPEAQKMLEQTKMTEDPGTLTAVHAFLQPKSFSSEAWNEYTSQTNGEILEQLHGVRKELGVGNKSFLMLLRYALTGMKDGPGLVDLIRVLGPEVTLKRFLDARGSQV
ncbi:glutamyl-tRNA synthetase [Dendrothele bispora CBS 962.96]|uniref:Glutamyl-tRNA synthetase n=1 Tax=Dendrothele bispora (strain CBS 962.96) TaxID=1314807 RepID=A0A4S8KRU9_DENBC|nr:glutamyl-tRNA synthetase [Dendrothele bispora CBS 962.96]